MARLTRRRVRIGFRLGLRLDLGRRPRLRPLLVLGADRIEADIDDVIVELGRRRQREREIVFDMRECRTGVVGSDRHRDPNELGDDGFRAGCRLVDDGEAERHVDLARAARGSDDDAALNADLHHQLTVDDFAVARGAHEGALVFQRHGVVAAIGRRRRNGQGRRALADVDQGAIDIGLLRIDDRARLVRRSRGREETLDLVFQRRRTRRCGGRQRAAARRRLRSGRRAAEAPTSRWRRARRIRCCRRRSIPAKAASASSAAAGARSSSTLGQDRNIPRFIAESMIPKTFGKLLLSSECDALDLITNQPWPSQGATLASRQPRARGRRGMVKTARVDL